MLLAQGEIQHRIDDKAECGPYSRCMLGLETPGNAVRLAAVTGIGRSKKIHTTSWSNLRLTPSERLMTSPVKPQQRMPGHKSNRPMRPIGHLCLFFVVCEMLRPWKNERAQDSTDQLTQQTSTVSHGLPSAFCIFPEGTISSGNVSDCYAYLTTSICVKSQRTPAGCVLL